MCDVFISHSSKDDSFVSQLAQELTAAGLKVWADHSTINPGDHIVLKIQEGLRKAKKVIPVLSPHYMESDWCQAEILDTLWNDPLNRFNRIVPVRIAHCEIPNLQRALSYIDCVPNETVGIQQTVDACRGLLPSAHTASSGVYFQKLGKESPFRAGGDFPLGLSGYIWRACDQKLISDFSQYPRIMIFGEQMSGKSSLLIRHEYWSKNSVVGLVKLDEMNDGPCDEFSQRVLEALIEYLSSKGGHYIAKTNVRLIEQILTCHDFTLVIDDYQRLQSVASARNFMNALNSLQKRPHNHCFKIIAASYVEPHVVAQNAGLDHLNFKDWYIINLKPFTTDDILIACRLFPEPISSKIIKHSAAILKQSDKPKVIQEKFEKLWRHCMKVNFETEEKLDDTILRFVDGRELI